jgi:hypothetical protein
MRRKLDCGSLARCQRLAVFDRKINP